MPRRKPKRYAVHVDDAGRASADRLDPRDFEDDWTPEHLILAALAKCIVTSLRHHARRDGLTVAAEASAAGAVFERPDGSWGFVELRCSIDATIEPIPAGDALPALLARSERGCFVGASLDPRPAYEWTVNGSGVG